LLSKVIDNSTAKLAVVGCKIGGFENWKLPVLLAVIIQTLYSWSFAYYHF
jgi:hypothetical protein